MSNPTTAAAAATSTTTTTTTTTTEAAVTVAEESSSSQYENFLDDPFNMAMYVVLPAMIFIYGGCCFIYCMAKLHRYCRRKARRRAKRRLIQNDGDDDSDDDDDHKKARDKGGSGQGMAVSVVDLTDPTPEPVKPAKPVKPVKPVVPPKPAAAMSVTRSSTAASSRISSRGMQPGYVKPGDLQKQMQHLDDQLKAAFKLITDEPKKVKSRPDVCAKSDENHKPVKKRRGDSRMHFFVSDQ